MKVILNNSHLQFNNAEKRWVLVHDYSLTDPRYVYGIFWRFFDETNTINSSISDGNNTHVEPNSARAKIDVVGGQKIEWKLQSSGLVDWGTWILLGFSDANGNKVGEIVTPTDANTIYSGETIVPDGAVYAYLNCRMQYCLSESSTLEDHAVIRVYEKQFVP